MKLKLATLICAVGVMVMGFATTAKAQDKVIVDTAARQAASKHWPRR